MNEAEYLDQEDQEKAVEIRIEDIIYRSDESPAVVHGRRRDDPADDATHVQARPRRAGRSRPNRGFDREGRQACHAVEGTCIGGRELS